MKDLHGRVALLTGASSGIGPYIARELKGEGVDLVLTARRKNLLDKLARELTGAEVIPADLTKREDVRRLAQRAGHVDILIANAGVGSSGKLIRLDPAEIDDAIEVNFRVPIMLVRLLLPRMLEKREGHVVLMSSMAGKFAGPNASIYNATKFGLRGFGLALRQELARSGVGLSTIYPTFVKDAGMWAETGLKAPALAGEVSAEQVAKAVVKAIKDNKIEVDVAPWTARVGGRFVGALPELVVGVADRIGASNVASDLAERSREAVEGRRR